MTQEDKQLLFKDLSARFPYRVVVETQLVNAPRAKYPVLKVLQSYMLCDFMQTIENVIHKPYLRPMSSMTKEEKEEMHNLLSPDGAAEYINDGIRTPMSHFGDFIPYEYMGRVLDWLNAHHFDFRNLIERELAIDCTNLNVY